MTKIERAIEDLKNGKLIVVLDDMDRENEGDLIGLPEFMDANTINFMITHGKGLLCAPVSKEIAIKHKLQYVPKRKSDGTNFLISIDSPKSTTGISAFERMQTFNDLLSNDTVEFMTPGHLFPLLAVQGTLSKRRGHTEAGVDLATLAGAKNVSAIIEIINQDGTMSRRDDLIKFSDEHNLTLITIEELVKYIEENKPEIWDFKEINEFEFTNEANVPTTYGDLKMKVAKDVLNNKDYIMVYNGDITKMKNPIVRVHSKCETSEIFGSIKCDCREQLQNAIKIIKEKSGLIIYTPDEGRGLGIFNKINSYHQQEITGQDTYEADLSLGLIPETREFSIIAKLLKQLNIRKIQLLTNNSSKISDLEKEGINVERIGHWVEHNSYADNYVETKIKKMNHIK